MKTTGFKTSPPKGQVQIKYAERIKYLEDGTFPADCKAAWDELKELLCNALTLAFPNFLKNFYIYVDGSKKCSYSVALHQKDNEGIEQLVLFLSKALNTVEKNYWAMELEVGALV